VSVMYEQRHGWQPALNGHLSRQPGAPESTVRLSQVDSPQ